MAAFARMSRHRGKVKIATVGLEWQCSKIGIGDSMFLIEAVFGGRDDRNGSRAKQLIGAARSGRTGRRTAFPKIPMAQPRCSHRLRRIKTLPTSHNLLPAYDVTMSPMGRM